jgi:hypothetical protein
LFLDRLELLMEFLEAFLNRRLDLPAKDDLGTKFFYLASQKRNTVDCSAKLPSHLGERFSFRRIFSEHAVVRKWREQ